METSSDKKILEERFKKIIEDVVNTWQVWAVEESLPEDKIPMQALSLQEAINILVQRAFFWKSPGGIENGIHSIVSPLRYKKDPTKTFLEERFSRISSTFLNDLQIKKLSEMMTEAFIVANLIDRPKETPSVTVKSKHKN